MMLKVVKLGSFVVLFVGTIVWTLANRSRELESAHVEQASLAAETESGEQADSHPRRGKPVDDQSKYSLAAEDEAPPSPVNHLQPEVQVKQKQQDVQTVLQDYRAEVDNIFFDHKKFLKEFDVQQAKEYLLDPDTSYLDGLTISQVETHPQARARIEVFHLYGQILADPDANPSRKEEIFRALQEVFESSLESNDPKAQKFLQGEKKDAIQMLTYYRRQQSEDLLLAQQDEQRLAFGDDFYLGLRDLGLEHDEAVEETRKIIPGYR